MYRKFYTFGIVILIFFSLILFLLFTSPKYTYKDVKIKLPPSLDCDFNKEFSYGIIYTGSAGCGSCIYDMNVLLDLYTSNEVVNNIRTPVFIINSDNHEYSEYMISENVLDEHSVSPCVHVDTSRLFKRLNYDIVDSNSLIFLVDSTNHIVMRGNSPITDSFIYDLKSFLP